MSVNSVKSVNECFGYRYWLCVGWGWGVIGVEKNNNKKRETMAINLTSNDLGHFKSEKDTCRTNTRTCKFTCTCITSDEHLAVIQIFRYQRLTSKSYVGRLLTTSIIKFRER